MVSNQLQYQKCISSSDILLFRGAVQILQGFLLQWHVQIEQQTITDAPGTWLSQELC